MDKTVIEKKRINIFNGLTALLLVHDAPISSIGHKVVTTNKRAPNIAISQYVSNLTFLILMWEKNNIDALIPMNVNPAIIMVQIVFTSEYYGPFYLKNNKKADFLDSLLNINQPWDLLVH